jgi:hypothetical protein
VGCVRYRNRFREIWQAQLLRSPAEAYSTGAAASGAGRGSRVLGPARVVGFIDLAETVARLPDQLLDGGACVGIRREFEHGVVASQRGSSPRCDWGALLLAYYDPDGRLIYAGRAGTGIGHAELERLWRRLQPLATATMPLDVPPPRDSRFGSPLVLSRVHWVRPELVAEVKFLAWTEDNLLRQVVYEGLRKDKPSADVCRPIPHPRPAP